MGFAQDLPHGGDFGTSMAGEGSGQKWSENGVADFSVKHIVLAESNLKGLKGLL